MLPSLTPAPTATVHGSHTLPTALHTRTYLITKDSLYYSVQPVITAVRHDPAAAACQHGPQQIHTDHMVASSRSIQTAYWHMFTGRATPDAGPPNIRVRGTRLLTLQLCCSALLVVRADDISFTDVVFGVAWDLRSESRCSLAGRPVRADDAGRATRQATEATQHTHCVRVRIA